MAWSEPGAGVLVVVPTYDEADTIDRLLDGVQRDLPGAHVLVVDDGSPDGTADRVRARPELGRTVFLHPRGGKEGLGSAYRAGFGWALDRGYRTVVQIDADLSHPTHRLPALVGALSEVDVAVGSRYVPGGAVRRWSWHRRMVSRLGNLYVALVLALGVRDATSGFKAFRREALLAIAVTRSRSEGYCFQVENTWRARRAGLRVVEVPITFTDRTAGVSKMSGAILVEAVLRVLLWRLVELVPSARTVGRLLARHRDLPTFLAVGGAGYVVDVLAFNLLRGSSVLPSSDPVLARCVAVVPAMVVTYLGNRLVTWRSRSAGGRTQIGRQLCLFLVFNLLGLGFSVVTLAISHHLLGLTSRLADNISANVVGLALGTAFRYATYRRYVFTRRPPRTVTTLAGWARTARSRGTSSWSTTRSGSSPSSGTTSARSAPRPPDAMTG
jgi:dolichol-phosphate mannosyltransferase